MEIVLSVSNPPAVSEIRERIIQTEDEKIRNALTLMYLSCGRAKEIISRTTPGDKSGRNKATGPKGSDTRIDDFGDFEIVLFNIYTQKRDDMKRIIALPIKYEPLALPLHNYMIQFGTKPVFNFTRQKLWLEGKPQFEGLTYPISKYTIWENGKITKAVSAHTKNFTLHALRHLRAGELVEYYGFSGFDLATYGGWTMRSTVMVSSMFDRYVSLQWRSYIGKLLKTRNW